MVEVRDLDLDFSNFSNDFCDFWDVFGCLLVSSSISSSELLACRWRLSRSILTLKPVLLLFALLGDGDFDFLGERRGLGLRLPLSVGGIYSYSLFVSIRGTLCLGDGHLA